MLWVCPNFWTNSDSQKPICRQIYHQFHDDMLERYSEVGVRFGAA